MMRRRSLVSVVRVGLLVLPILLVAAEAAARPGGGHSYSGGSRSSGSGGGFSGGGHSSGDGSAGLFLQLILLAIEHPAFGVPLLLVVVAVMAARAGLLDGIWGGRTADSWSTANSRAYAPEPQPAALSRRSLEAIRSVDPDFSVVLFEDFVSSLYAQLHTARGAGQLARLGPYVQSGALGSLAMGGSLREVRGLVIGSVTVTDVRVGDAQTPTTVSLRIEANYSELVAATEHRLYVVEALTLVRGPGARSRPPARARTLDCPSCGAPLQGVSQGRCSHCGQHVDGGRFDWCITRLAREHVEQRRPLSAGDAAEEGNDLRTVVDASAQERVRQLMSRDPAFDYNQFLARVGLIFAHWQIAWATRDLSKARPFLSDGLMEAQAGWIRMYQEEHLRNVTENARIVRTELAAVTSDRWYDAITLRVHAMGLDYTVRDDGNVVSGSRARERAYSEYWTLIRASQRTGKPTRATPECPNCGAPLAVEMSGDCKYCRARVTTGEFDWVLSRIEQDEAYTG